VYLHRRGPSVLRSTIAHPPRTTGLTVICQNREPVGAQREEDSMIQQTKSLEFYERVEKVTPGCQSNLKFPWGYVPLIMVRGSASHLWDLDGNEYIDWMCCSGPGIFGYDNPELNGAVKEQLDTLFYSISGNMQTTLELDVASKIVEHVPCAEKVRFCLAGSEAVQLAIRLCRTHTGRPYFLRFDDMYHGWLDNVLGGLVDAGAIEGGEMPFALEDPKRDGVHTGGRSPVAMQESLKIPWNDFDALEAVVEKYGDQIAVMMMEPIACNRLCCPPKPGYLEKARELCDRHGIMLYFDEIITGFRVGLGGAQEMLGVTPDICTLGKAMGAGWPISAVAGRRELLDLLLEKKVVHGGTYNGWPMALAAIKVTFELLERDDGAFFRHLDHIQGRLVGGLKELAKKHGLPLFCQGTRGVFFHMFIDRDDDAPAYQSIEVAKQDYQKLTEFHDLMADRGVLLMWGGRWFISLAHTNKDVDDTLEKADEVFGLLAE
jgi:glutamate-1-semialdehyde 2,1-aminomutase